MFNSIFSEMADWFKLVVLLIFLSGVLTGLSAWIAGCGFSSFILVMGVDLFVLALACIIYYI